MIKHLNDINILIKNKKPVFLIVAGASDKSVLEAVFKAQKNSGINPVLLGDKTQIENIIEDNKFRFSDAQILNITDPVEMIRYAALRYKNKEKVVLMKGLITTADILKELIKKDNGLVSTGFLSHFALFENKNYHKLFGVTDVAMNIAPNLHDKEMILKNAVNVFKVLGKKKIKIACLSVLEYVNNKIESSVHAEELSKIQIDDCIICGPLALDNAINRKSAELKNVKDEVAGDADILLVPEINSGNIFYKSLIYLGKSKCAAVVTGANIPVVLTSRADNYENKYYSILLGIALLN